MTDEELIEKQNAEQAPPVSPAQLHLGEVVEDVRQSAQDREPIINKEAEIIAQGSESEFWQVLKKRLEAKIQQMKRAQSVRMTKGDISLQDVGLRALIINEVTDAFEELIHMVEYASRKSVIINNSSEEDLPETLNEINEPEIQTEEVQS